MNWMSLLMVLCALSFYAYGWSCLHSQHMAAEFKRYRLTRFRRLTGALQLLAATGLMIGLLLPWVGGLAASGLSLQMACGLGIRIKAGDTWLQCIPAAIFMILCGWLATQLL